MIILDLKSMKAVQDIKKFITQSDQSDSHTGHFLEKKQKFTFLHPSFSEIIQNIAKYTFL